MNKYLYPLLFRVLLVVVLAAAWMPAMATTYVRDVLLVGGGKQDILTGETTLIPQGWKMSGQDLNDGAGGDYIHLFYKTESFDDGFNYGAITDFIIANNYSDEIEYEGRSYFPVPCDGGTSFKASKGNVNNGTDGPKIYLYYTRDYFSDKRVVTGISFNSTPTGAVRSINGTTFSNWGYSLNAGNDGADLIYMHVTTATALEPVQIGNGTSGNSTIPFYFANEAYPYSLSQQIYTAEDIGTAGSIKAISFFHRMDDKSLSMNGIQIYMKHTDKDSFTGSALDPKDGFTKVFDGNIAVSGKQWLMILLDTPFEYDGNSNLMICCYDPIGTPQPQGNTFTIHYADNKMRSAASSTLIDWNNLPQVASSTSMRNDIRLNIVPNPYRNPVSLAVTELSENAATVSWLAPSGSHPPIQCYEWQYKKSEDATWSGLTSTSGTSVSLNGLSAFTEYQFRVRILYDGGESSYSLLRFVTAVSLPHFCGFEDGMPGWSQVDYNHVLNIDYTGISGDARHEGTYGYKFQHYSDETPQYLISPRLPGNRPVLVSFYYRNTSTSASQVGKFKVGYSTSTSDINDFHWEDELTAEGSQWMQYNNDFPSGTRFVAIQSYAQNTDLYLDDFLFEAYSSLARPTGLSVSELGDQRVTLKWNAPDEATDYIYQYRQENVSNWSSEASVNGTSVTLDGLTANTTYEFRVKARYDSGASNFVTFQFLTEGLMEAIPHYQDFENGMGGWRLENGSGRSGISTRAFHGGSHSFEFDEGSPEAQCLRSPLLEGNDAEKVVSFYFKNYAEQSGESIFSYVSSFQVGWSTQTNQLSDFVGTSEIAADHGQWVHFSLQVPKDAKYVMIRVKDHQAWLYVDDISITTVPQPVATAASVMGEVQYAATFYDGSRNWQLPKGGLAYTVRKEGEDFVFYCIGDVIQAGTPVIILLDKQAGDTESTKVIPLSVTTSSGLPSLYNILQGTDSPVAVSNGKIGEKTVYVLGIKNGKLGFYPFSGNTIPAGKAYYLAE